MGRSLKSVLYAVLCSLMTLPMHFNINILPDWHAGAVKN